MDKSDDVVKLPSLANESCDGSEPLGKRQRCEGEGVKEEEDNLSTLNPSNTTSDVDHLGGNLSADSTKVQSQPGNVDTRVASKEKDKVLELSEADDNQNVKDGVTREEDGSQESKDYHLVLGINAVTRLLEQKKLEVGLVCTTTPYLLYQHLIPLAAMAEVSFAAVPDLSQLLSRCLGVKRTACIGIKVVINMAVIANRIIAYKPDF